MCENDIKPKKSMRTNNEKPANQSRKSSNMHTSSDAGSKENEIEPPAVQEKNTVQSQRKKPETKKQKPKDKSGGNAEEFDSTIPPRTIIVGDSIISKLEGWRMSRP